MFTALTKEKIWSQNYLRKAWFLFTLLNSSQDKVSSTPAPHTAIAKYYLLASRTTWPSATAHNSSDSPAGRAEGMGRSRQLEVTHSALSIVSSSADSLR